MKIKEELDKGFLIIPVEVLTTCKVSSKPFSFAEKCIYSYLLHWSNNSDKVFPSTRKICMDLGIGSRNSLSKYIGKLEEKGLVSIIKEKGKSSLYTVLPLPQDNKKPLEVSITRGTNKEREVIKNKQNLDPVSIIDPYNYDDSNFDDPPF